MLPNTIPTRPDGGEMKLAYELTKYQIDIEQRLEFMSELMLLD